MAKHFIITVGDFRDSSGRYLSLRTPFYRPLNRALHRIGATWRKELKCWLLAYSKEHWVKLQEAAEPFGSLEIITKKPLSLTLIQNIKPQTRSYLESYQEMLYARGYAQNTINTYTNMMCKLLSHQHPTPPQELTIILINKYRAAHLFQQANSTQRQFVSALKLLLQHFNNPIQPDTLVRPRANQTKPKVIAVEEVIRMIARTQNVKHRLIISFLYSCGLRRGEVLNLEPKDLNLERGSLHVREGKWGKERLLPLPQSIYPFLKEYIHFYQPTTYLFEGQKSDQYSPTSVAKIVQREAKNAGIHQHVTPHMLRHSYATHLLEKGVDMRYIQELLGHSKPETTMIYTHVAKHTALAITSPLDTALRENVASQNKSNDFKGLGKNK